MFLDIDTQQCVHCAKGSYSLGGGIRFDEFTQLPTGFVVENVDVNVDRMLTNQRATEWGILSIKKAAHFLFLMVDYVCFRTGWIVKNSELMYVPTPCLSKLTYSATLVRPGYVEYTYRMPRNSRGLVFNVVVRNEQCQSYRDQLKQLVSSTTKGRPSHRSEEDGEWQRRRIELRTGPNVITWSVANNRDAISTADVITLSKIDVVGKRDRPKCTENDYYPTIEPCIDGKTRTVYKKVQPNICRDDIPGSVKVGFRTMKIFAECKRCPIDTIPNYGFQYILWNNLPPNMATRCEYLTEGEHEHFYLIRLTRS
uniref:Elapor1-like galactose binding domain-containing protein n=1 Tax=Parascaris equorum TaxID=6256 RepID=A0A914S5F3_PAREQ